MNNSIDGIKCCHITLLLLLTLLRTSFNKNKTNNNNTTLEEYKGSDVLVVTAGKIPTKIYYCEAQGKGRARGGPRKVTERSFIDGGWWMVVYLSLMLYTKFGCHPPPTTTTHQKFNFTQLMARWGSGGLGGGKGRCVGSLWVTYGSL